VSPAPVSVPRWDTAGATWVSDTGPYEARKLLLLNGAHSLLAYTAPLRGHRTVAEAIADHLCLTWVHQWWDEARPYVPVPESAFDDFRQALLLRWANSAIEHRLTQIAEDGSQKLPVRVLPLLRAERAAGRLPMAACRTLAGWVLSLRTPEGPAPDPRAVELVGLSRGALSDAVSRVLGALDATLTDDPQLVAAVVAVAQELDAMTDERIHP
jgi:fructuronate reductase